MSAPRILVVDDEPNIRDLLMTSLKFAGYQVKAVANGASTISAVLEEEPDLILLDVVMPKMGGFEACQRLRELEATRDIPIILVTTRGEEHNVERGYELGCNDYLTKPISSLDLLTKVENALGV